jgi:hypothetical protein
MFILRPDALSLNGSVMINQSIMINQSSPYPPNMFMAAFAISTFSDEVQQFVTRKLLWLLLSQRVTLSLYNNSPFRSRVVKLKEHYCEHRLVQVQGCFGLIW